MTPLVWIVVAFVTAIVVMVLAGSATGARPGVRQFVADLRDGCPRRRRHLPTRAADRPRVRRPRRAHRAVRSRHPSHDPHGRPPDPGLSTPLRPERLPV